MRILILLAVFCLSIFTGATACSSKPASLSEVTMAKSVDSTTQAPVDKANVFLPSTEVIYCSVKLSDAPANTKVRSVWVATDVPGVEKGKVVDETTIDASGTKYIGFSLSKSAKRWPTGQYGVNLYLGDKQVATAQFAVQSNATLSEITTSTAVDSATKAPKDSTSVFPVTTKTVYATAKLSNAPAKTEVRTVWTIVDAQGEQAGRKLGEYAVETDGDRYVSFNYTIDVEKWPVGKYAVKFYLDDTEISTANFSTQAVGPAATISEVTMASSVDQTTKAPKTKTTVFAPGAESIYCSVKINNAPVGTTATAVWTVANVPGIDKGLVIDETDVEVDGTRYVAFSLSRQNEGWPVGTYTVELYLNDKLVSSAYYSVVAATPTPAPTVSSALSGIITEATMAKSLDATTREAKEKTSVFTPDTSVLYCSVGISKAPANTAISASWVVVDVPEVETGYEIETTDVTTDGTRYIGFSLSKGDNPWPAGKYAVELYVNDRFVKSVPYSVAK